MPGEARLESNYVETEDAPGRGEALPVDCQRQGQALPGLQATHPDQEDSQAKATPGSGSERVCRGSAQDPQDASLRINPTLPGNGSREARRGAGPSLTNG